VQRLRPPGNLDCSIIQVGHLTTVATSRSVYPDPSLWGPPRRPRSERCARHPPRVPAHRSRLPFCADDWTRRSTCSP